MNRHSKHSRIRNVGTKTELHGDSANIKVALKRNAMDVSLRWVKRTSSSVCAGDTWG